MIGKLIGKTLALPIKAVIAIPDEAAKAVEEIAKAFDPEDEKR